jgi:hypothetical protein
MAEIEDNTASEEPQSEEPTVVAEPQPEPEPEPAPGVVDEGTVIVHGRGGRKRVSMSEYRAMKEADGA